VSNDATRVPPSPYAEALQNTGISRQTANRWQGLAAVPAETFEQHLRPRRHLLVDAEVGEGGGV
jgi:hypothetical protein